MVTMAWPVVDGQQQAPYPRLATMAPRLRRLSMERPWHTIALMALAPHGAGLALAKPASQPASQPAMVDRCQPIDPNQSCDCPGANPLVVE